MTMRDFVIPKAMLACKVFLKKWPHWGSCECTGWWTPNTVLYMEEKPRGEKRFWRVSAGWPVADRNQEVSAAQHQEGKEQGHCKHLYFRGVERKEISASEQETEGFSAALMCKEAQLQGIDWKAGRSLAPHQIVQHDHQSRRRVAWQLTICVCQFDIRIEETWSCPDVGGIRHVSMQKNGLWDGTFTHFDSNDILMS